jgi:hypothetical protein
MLRGTHRLLVILYYTDMYVLCVTCKLHAMLIASQYFNTARMKLVFLFLHVVLSAYISYLDFVHNLLYAVSVNRRRVIIRMTITYVTVATH